MGPERQSMGTLYLDCTVENWPHQGQSAVVSQMLVDSGIDHTWVPAKVLESIGVQRQKKDLAFTMANGTTITRSVGFAVIRYSSFFTVDEIVFGEPGDLAL